MSKITPPIDMPRPKEKVDISGILGSTVSHRHLSQGVPPFAMKDNLDDLEKIVDNMKREFSCVKIELLRMQKKTERLEDELEKHKATHIQ